METEQLTTEDWKELKKEQQESNKARRDARTDILYRFCQLNDIEIKELTEYQFRLSKIGFPDIDVYPTSSKVHVLEKGKKGKYKKVIISKFLENIYRGSEHKINS